MRVNNFNDWFIEEIVKLIEIDNEKDKRIEELQLDLWDAQDLYRYAKKDSERLDKIYGYRDAILPKNTLEKMHYYITSTMHFGFYTFLIAIVGFCIYAIYSLF